MTEPLATEQKLREGLKEEVRSLIDDKVRNISMILEKGAQTRSGYSVTTPLPVIDLMEDVMGVDNPVQLRNPNDWDSPIPVFFSTTLNNKTGRKVRLMAVALQDSRGRIDGKRIQFALMDSTYGAIAHRIKEHNAGEVYNPFRDPLEANISSSGQLAAIKRFIQEVSPINPNIT